MELESRWSAVKEPDGSLAGFLVWELNNEDRRQSDENLLRAQRMESISTLAGGVAHDINNVLSVILCTAQMVAEDLGPDHACTEDLHAIEQAVDSAAGLMRKLLVFTGRQVTVPQSVDVSSWIGQ